MSNFDDAFKDLLDAHDAELGEPQLAKVGKKNHRAIIEEITSDEIAIAGGLAESGGYRITVSKHGFARRPRKGERVIARGNSLQIASVTERNNCTYEITAGDLAAER